MCLPKYTSTQIEIEWASGEMKKVNQEMCRGSDEPIMNAIKKKTNKKLIGSDGRPTNQQTVDYRVAFT